MNCLHCEDEFLHHPTHVYWCSPECWEEARVTTWRLMPNGPEPLAAKVRLGVKRPTQHGIRRHRTKISEATIDSVVFRLQCGESHHHIAKMTGVSRGTVYNINQREIFQGAGMVSSPAGAGEGTAGVPA